MERKNKTEESFLMKGSKYPRSVTLFPCTSSTVSQSTPLLLCFVVCCVCLLGPPRNLSPLATVTRGHRHEVLPVRSSQWNCGHDSSPRVWFYWSEGLPPFSGRVWFRHLLWRVHTVQFARLQSSVRPRVFDAACGCCFAPLTTFLLISLTNHVA